MYRISSSFSYRVLSVFILILLNLQLAVSQDLRITGKVTDEDNNPLPGVNVFEEGTTSGVITDLNGNYTINVASGNSNIIFSYVGYSKVAFAVGERRIIDVVLKEEITNLDELIVIGYGVKKKADLSSAISVVNADELARTGSPNFDDAIQGRASGVLVSQTSGMPGTSPSVKIRGIGSINQDSEPLYIVDGVPTGQLFAINSNDIESIQILKDASATAIYGAQAANGVVLINTKKGQAGKTKLSFTGEKGVSYFTNNLDLMNADEYSRFMSEAYTRAREIYGVDQTFPVAYTDSMQSINGNISTDWQEELTRPGNKENYNLSVSGGNDKLVFSGSGGYYKEEGTLISTGVERFTLRANSDAGIKDWLTLGESLLISKINTDRGADWVWGSMNSSPLMPVYNEENLGGYAGPDPLYTGKNERTNPVAISMLEDTKEESFKILTSLYAELKILEKIRYKFQLGFDYNMGSSRFWKPKYELGGGRSNSVSTLTEYESNGKRWIADNTLSYDDQFGDHNISLLAGYSAQYTTSDYIRIVGSDFIDDNLNVISQAQQMTSASGEIYEHKLVSQFGRMMYDYQGKYLVSGTIRRDGSSNFGPKNKFGYFPSVSAAWKINEDLLRDIDQINLLKLRIGWGATGNQDIPSFAYLALLNKPTDFRYIFGPNEQTVFGQGLFESFGNEDIKWESAKMWNVGLDLFAFRNRLQVTAEYYIKNQDGMLVQINLPGIYGLGLDDIDIDISSANPWVNLGEIQNKGLDLSAVYQKMEGDFNYRINVNLTTIKNTVNYLPYESYIANDHITIEDHTIGSFYGYIADGIFQSQEEIENHPFQAKDTAPGDIRYLDLNMDGIVNQNDMTIIGKPIPDMTFGFGLDLFYKNVDFTIFSYGMINIDVYNRLRTTIGVATDKDGLDNNKLAETLDYWTQENPSETMARAHVIDPNNNARFSTWFLEEASFLRIKSIQLGYTLPTGLLNRMKISRLRVYAATNNSFVFSRYRGYDPEVGSKNPLNAGVDNGAYPVPKSFTVGLQIDL
jgi:TonB-linked SusC/RagA family outer membrane protein